MDVPRETYRVEFVEPRLGVDPDLMVLSTDAVGRRQEDGRSAGRHGGLETGPDLVEVLDPRCLVDDEEGEGLRPSRVGRRRYGRDRGSVVESGALLRLLELGEEYPRR